MIQAFTISFLSGAVMEFAKPPTWIFIFKGLYFSKQTLPSTVFLTKLYDVENVGCKTHEKIYHVFQSSVSVAA